MAAQNAVIGALRMVLGADGLKQANAKLGVWGAKTSAQLDQVGARMAKFGALAGVAIAAAALAGAARIRFNGAAPDRLEPAGRDLSPTAGTGRRRQMTNSIIPKKRTGIAALALAPQWSFRHEHHRSSRRA